MENIYGFVALIIGSNGLISAILGIAQLIITRRDNRRNVERQLKGLEDRMDLESAKSARREILRFADDLHNSYKHSKESFDQILVDTDCYDNYCQLHPEFANNRTQMSSAFIKETYRKEFLETKNNERRADL